MRLTAPSMLPELQSRVSPAVTASRSRSRWSAKPVRPGSWLASTASIQVGSVEPRRSVSISPKSRTCPAAVSSSGQRARTSFRPARPSSVRPRLTTVETTNDMDGALSLAARRQVSVALNLGSVPSSAPSRPSRNAGDLGCALPGDGRGVRCGWWPVAVFGPFERPVGHLAFDDAGAGPVAPWGQQAFGDLSQGAGQGPGESAGGKTPPGPGPGGARSAGTG